MEESRRSQAVGNEDPPDQKRVGRHGGEIHYQVYRLIISEVKQRFSHQSRYDGCRGGCHVVGGEEDCKEGIHAVWNCPSPQVTALFDSNPPSVFLTSWCYSWLLLGLGALK